MYPLNWAGRLLNDCTEIMFRIATDDIVRSLKEIEEAKETLDSLEKCIKRYAYQKKGVSDE